LSYTLQLLDHLCIYRSRFLFVFVKLFLCCPIHLFKQLIVLKCFIYNFCLTVSATWTFVYPARGPIFTIFYLFFSDYFCVAQYVKPPQISTSTPPYFFNKNILGNYTFYYNISCKGNWDHQYLYQVYTLESDRWVLDRLGRILLVLVANQYMCILSVSIAPFFCQYCWSVDGLGVAVVLVCFSTIKHQ
jgi:hypothetical protein